MLLRRLLEWIERFAEDEEAPPLLMFLGDIVDRGPDSRGAMDLVVASLERWPGSTLILGNHDLWFRDFLSGRMREPEDLELWLEQGGIETLRSYGFGESDLRGVATRIAAEHPAHVSVLCGAALTLRHGPYLFVHAGIDPNRPLDRQGEAQFLWIRAPFLNHVGPLGPIVVHGHTPQKGGVPSVTENRISLDTGAFRTGALTAAVWPGRQDPSRPVFMATTPPDGTVRRVEPQRFDRGFGTVLD